ncbi:TPA: hypothetical protein P5R56_003004 [Legionella pneumophila]|nr:hypothetical protein [Legionella pneumophila]HDO9922926.1 hypothetical protein [Legionella pneumophila]HDV6670987.1 hypothetical protein [Legionella pneumophila]
MASPSVLQKNVLNPGKKPLAQKVIEKTEPYSPKYAHSSKLMVPVVLTILKRPTANT